ncbi:Kinesin-like protein [Trichinella spiralis]|uniref:Kinesin-like protein n=1 Tax=Trichinella spiralis TaxID=6334 RepID=A0ABR3KA79_TRISP
MKLSGNIVLKVSSAFSSSAVRFRQTNPICIRHPTFRPFSHPVSTYQKHLAVDLGRHRRRRIHISIDWQRKLFALVFGFPYRGLFLFLERQPLLLELSFMDN